MFEKTRVPAMLMHPQGVSLNNLLRSPTGGQTQSVRLWRPQTHKQRQAFKVIGKAGLVCCRVCREDYSLVKRPCTCPSY